MQRPQTPMAEPRGPTFTQNNVRNEVTVNVQGDYIAQQLNHQQVEQNLIMVAETRHEEVMTQAMRETELRHNNELLGVVGDAGA